MKQLKSSILLFAIFIIGAVFFSSCEKKEINDPISEENQFVSLESPYLICAVRNPGGVGFDFVYHGKKGGANYMDSLTVSDFEYDLIIRTIKAEKPDGSLGGAPFIRLYETVKAVNYSNIDTTCKGYTAFLNLNSTNIQNYTLEPDEPGFNLANVPVGNTGYPLMQELNQEFNKLVIGARWKEAASNAIPDDEPIWLIQTREGRIVKFIVTQLPANPAPTSTGYVSIEWDFVQ